MKTTLLKTMTTLAFEAGKIAVDNIGDSKPTLKQDHSVVTKTDSKISRLAHYTLDSFLQTGKHILIDEESPSQKKYLNQSILQKTPYVWSIDPIDGTRLYANRIPYYGISIGLMKDLKPWLGVVYFPSLNELFYSDGVSAHYVRNAFCAKSTKRTIIKVDQKISDHTILLCNDNFYKYNRKSFLKLNVAVSGCAIVDLCWPAIGRGCGSIFKSSLWDFAGSWPIFEAAGLSLRSIEDGKQLKKINVDLFEKQKSAWKLKSYYILSSKRNFGIIKKKVGM